VWYQSDLIINNDSLFGGTAGAMTNLVVNALATNPNNSPVLVWQGDSAITFFGSATFNGTATVRVDQTLTILGGLLGTGSFPKWTAGTMSIGGDSSAYTGNITVNQGPLELLNGNAAQAAGTGTITVNPAGIFRTAARVSNAITINSDGAQLGVLGLAYVGALPATLTFNKNGGPFEGVVAIDVTGY